MTKETEGLTDDELQQYYEEYTSERKESEDNSEAATKDRHEPDRS